MASLSDTQTQIHTPKKSETGAETEESKGIISKAKDMASGAGEKVKDQVKQFEERGKGTTESLKEYVPGLGGEKKSKDEPILPRLSALEDKTHNMEGPMSKVGIDMPPAPPSLTHPAGKLSVLDRLSVLEEYYISIEHSLQKSQNLQKSQKLEGAKAEEMPPEGREEKAIPSETREEKPILEKTEATEVPPKETASGVSEKGKKQKAKKKYRRKSPSCFGWLKTV